MRTGSSKLTTKFGNQVPFSSLQNAKQVHDPVHNTDENGAIRMTCE